MPAMQLKFPVVKQESVTEVWCPVTLCCVDCAVFMILFIYGL